MMKIDIAFSNCCFLGATSHVEKDTIGTFEVMDGCPNKGNLIENIQNTQYFFHLSYAD